VEKIRETEEDVYFITHILVSRNKFATKVKGQAGWPAMR
jgi:hypothetical protein